MKYLHCRFITIVIYIDNTLLIARTVEELKCNIDLTMKTLEQAGFILNYQKSHLVSTTRIEFLGFIIDTVEYSIQLTDSKLDNLLNIITKALNSHRISIWFLSKLIGKIIALFPCCEKAPLHYRILDHFKVKML